MKEFIEKLIGRLEEEKNTAYKTYETFEMKVDLGRAFGIEKSIEIVNQLADEYEECFNLCSENCEVYDKEKHYCPKWCKVIRETVEELKEEYFKNAMIDGQYCFQTCGATEHCKECNRLGNGSIDYYENYDVLAEEHNNDFCEWKFETTGIVWHCNGCETYNLPYAMNLRIIADDFECKCPHCGKKIKVVE